MTKVRFHISSQMRYMLAIAFVLLAGGMFIWHIHEPEIADLSDQITTAQANVVSYQSLIAKKNVFRHEYTKLAGLYLMHQASPTLVEAQFTDVLSSIAQRDDVTFVGITYGTVNGSNPPPPDPYVDANGQPIKPPADVTAAPSDAITNLGGRGNGDPKIGRPNIPTDLFTRVPAGVTFKGKWDNLLTALQDISKQNVLMGISQPEIRRLSGSQLAASFSVQLLTPAITVVPELLDRSSPQKAVRRPAQRTARQAKVVHRASNIQHRRVARTAKARPVAANGGNATDELATAFGTKK